MASRIIVPGIDFRRALRIARDISLAAWAIGTLAFALVLIESALA